MGSSMPGAAALEVGRVRGYPTLPHPVCGSTCFLGAGQTRVRPVGLQICRIAMARQATITTGLQNKLLKSFRVVIP
jgi:hypothetical protein